MKAMEVMTSPVVTVTPPTPVPDIAALLLDRRISAVPVVDERGCIVGIVSEGDLLRRGETRTIRQRPRWLELLVDRHIQAADFVKSHGARAQDVMTRDVVTVSPNTHLAEIASLLERRRIKRVPVVDNGVPVGIVSRANLLHGLVTYRNMPSAGKPATDPDIRRGVEEALREEPWVDPSRLNIVVSNGVVHLWGTIRSDDQRRALKIAAENVPGVRGIEDHLSPDWFVNDTA